MPNQQCIPHPRRRPPARTRRAPARPRRGARSTTCGARARIVPDAGPARPHPRAGARGHRRPGHASRPLGRRVQPLPRARRRPDSVHVDELYETHPLEGETYPLDDDIIDLEPLVRDALLLELPLAPAVPPRLRTGLCPSCGVDHEPTRAATAPPRSSIPAGPRCGRSSSDLSTTRSQELPMAVPKRKMSRSATRSRKSRQHAARPRPRTRCARTAARRSSRTWCAATVVGTEAARSSTSMSQRGARPVTVTP